MFLLQPCSKLRSTVGATKLPVYASEVLMSIRTRQLLWYGVHPPEALGTQRINHYYSIILLLLYIFSAK